jgi:hypothetical protein
MVVDFESVGGDRRQAGVDLGRERGDEELARREKMRRTECGGRAHKLLAAADSSESNDAQKTHCQNGLVDTFSWYASRIAAREGLAHQSGMQFW